MASSNTKSRAQLAKLTKDQLIAEFRELQDRVANAPEVPATAQVSNAIKAQTTLAAAKATSVDDIVAQGAKFGLECQRVVASLVEQTAAKATQLKTITDAIEVATEDLQRAYEIDLAKSAIEVILDDHAKTMQELHDTIEDTRASWIEEQAEYKRANERRISDLTEERKREAAEYDYKTKQERARSADEFMHRQQIAERALADRKATFDKQIAEATALHQATGEALEKERQRLAALEGELKATAEKATHAAVNKALADARHAHELEKKDLANANGILNQRLSDLMSQNTRLVDEVNVLRGELKTARAEVAAVAEKAFAATSGQAALKAVMEHSTVSPANSNGGKARAA